MKQDKTLKDGEASGKIRTMPEAKIQETFEIEKPKVISTPDDFRIALGNAQLDGEDYIEVDEKLFKYLLKNNKSKYLTYGDPGIKVYLAGTKGMYDLEDKMSAEQYHEYITKKQME